MFDIPRFVLFLSSALVLIWSKRFLFDLFCDWKQRAASIREGWRWEGTAGSYNERFEDKDKKDDDGAVGSRRGPFKDVLVTSLKA